MRMTLIRAKQQRKAAATAMPAIMPTFTLLVDAGISPSTRTKLEVSIAVTEPAFKPLESDGSSTKLMEEVGLSDTA